ncbi:MAG: hypothetical protein EXR49_01020 [Dehalococcoidia bacterium]|nr:hypothetical protein [Dehalococcoidia bacterium]
MDSIEVSAILPATPLRVYRAWLDSAQHSAMTGGGAAEIDPAVGGRFTAWDGYISGVTLETDSPRRIVQGWRTTEFAKRVKDSRLAVLVEKAQGGAKITLRHTEIPKGQGEGYRQGGLDYYLEPMQAYFAAKG